MITFGMYRTVQTLADNTPLHSKIAIIIKGSTLIRTPAHGTMIYDDVLMLFSPKCIATIRLTFSCEIIRSHSKTHKTNNDIISLYRNRIAFHTNTVSGSCLTGNCQVTVYYFQWAVQIYQSTHCKHNRTRSALADTVTQSPFFVGVCQ